jgi:hypothetical protein
LTALSSVSLDLEALEPTKYQTREAEARQPGPALVQPTKQAQQVLKFILKNNENFEPIPFRSFNHFHSSGLWQMTTIEGKHRDQSLLTFQNMLSPACSSTTPSNAKSKNTYNKAQLNN